MDFIGFPMDSLVFHEFHLFPMVLIGFPTGFFGFQWIPLVFQYILLPWLMPWLLLNERARSHGLCGLAARRRNFLGGGRWFTRSPPLESPTFMGGGRCINTRPPLKSCRGEAPELNTIAAWHFD